MRINPTKGVPPLLVARLDPDRPYERCHWFLNCNNPTAKEANHPTLGWIPICDNHMTWLEEDAKWD